MFAHDRPACRAIEQVALESKRVCIYKTMHVFPGPYELTRLLNCFNPDLVFLELRPLEDAEILAKAIQVICPGTAVIGFEAGSSAQPAQLGPASPVGEILPVVLAEQSFMQSVERAVRKARPNVQDNLLAFLPAKAGSGSTTVAVNTAGCLANDLSQKVLVVEADLRSGLLSVLLKITPEYSILDALESADRLDGTLWNRIVVKAHGLDLLAAPATKNPIIVSWENYHQLLQFARSRYHSVVVDLPEIINDATAEIARRAARIFIVTTPELAPLFLARQRRQELRNRGIADDRIAMIVNRWTRNDIKVEDVEQFLEAPVCAVFQNDYYLVRRAIQDGRLIGSKSELGKTFSAFAHKMAGSPAPAEPPKTSLAFLQSLIPKRVHV